MLGQHPEMYGLPEVDLFLAETMREREGLVGQSWSKQGLERAIAQLLTGKQTVQSILFARKWLRLRAHRTCLSVFRELGKKVQPRRLVDKSPRITLSTEYLYRARKAFPDARFIHLTRHPRSQCESLCNLGQGRVPGRFGVLDYRTWPPTPDFQRFWYSRNINIVSFLAGVPEEQKLHIRGEDLLAEPESYLRKISEWLGLRTDEEAIEAMMHPEQSPYACLGPPNARLGNDPHFLREPRLRRGSSMKPPPRLDGPLSWREDGKEFSPEVKELAREFGYT